MTTTINEIRSTDCAHLDGLPDGVRERGREVLLSLRVGGGLLEREMDRERDLEMDRELDRLAVMDRLRRGGETEREKDLDRDLVRDLRRGPRLLLRLRLVLRLRLRLRLREL